MTVEEAIIKYLPTFLYDGIEYITCSVEEKSVPSMTDAKTDLMFRYWLVRGTAFHRSNEVLSAVSEVTLKLYLKDLTEKSVSLYYDVPHGADISDRRILTFDLPDGELLEVD